jgi:putative sigma-54 modulation protein
VEAHVILAVDGRERQLAELDLHTRGTTILAKEEHHDLYAAIDLAIDKFERQITKQKEKIKLERRKSKRVKITDFLSRETIVPALASRDKNAALEEMAEVFGVDASSR